MAQRTLLQLTDELAARGYDYLNTDRRRQFINDSIAELAEAFPWPFLEGTYVGAAPVDMGALSAANYSRSVMSVNDANTARALPYIERTILAKRGVNFATTGAAQSWYWQGTSLKTYPVTTDNVVVEYIGAVVELDEDTDSISAPTQFFTLIIDGAVIRALQDTDNYAEVQAARQDWRERLGVLEASYAARQVEPSYILITDPEYNC